MQQKTRRISHKKNLKIKNESDDLPRHSIDNVVLTTMPVIKQRDTNEDCVKTVTFIENKLAEDANTSFIEEKTVKAFIKLPFSVDNVGPPIPCCKVKLVDVPDMNYFASENKGEVCVQGLTVFQGYLKDTEKTESTIDKDGWLHTGDIGMWLPDGKLLPALIVRDAKEERLAIIVSFGDREQLIGVPKSQNATGKEQTHAVWIALTHWCLETNVQILCSDMTASDTGHSNGACILLEQKLNSEMLFFPCRHHIYELVVRSVFESKICELAKSPDILFFQELRKKLEKHQY
ncbi:Long-chain-fatty-acid--CoA ligase 1 [Araneus ventricosus]|uniref:long-chain-fatty-acid--CoA ligase n=1 Tax=Araneus ventricosus TaxID=182803 RepID=A0A4Y2NKS3_ARAVE|nr:Long-chain-fatty-acid--CoA ligase 1 [Araneus ventricosus]